MSATHGNFELPLCIPYRPSRRLFFLVTAIHLGAAAAIVSAAVPGWVQMLGGLCIAASGVTHFNGFRREYMRQPPRQLMSTRGGEWMLVEADGKPRKLTPAPLNFVHPYLLILRFNARGGADHDFVLMPDNTDADVLRRIRVRMRFPRKYKGTE